MSVVGGPISAGVAGAPEAQKRVSDSKEKRRNDEAKRRQRFEDSLELHISKVESQEAVQSVKEHASEDAESERQAKPNPKFHPRAQMLGMIHTGPVTYGPPTANQAAVGKASEEAPPDEHGSIDVTG